MGIVVTVTSNIAEQSLIEIKFPVVPVSAFAKIALCVCVTRGGISEVEVVCFSLGFENLSLTTLATLSSLIPTPQLPPILLK